MNRGQSWLDSNDYRFSVFLPPVLPHFQQMPTPKDRYLPRLLQPAQWHPHQPPAHPPLLLPAIRLAYEDFWRLPDLGLPSRAQPHHLPGANVPRSRPAMHSTRLLFHQSALHRDRSRQTLQCFCVDH